MDPAQVLAQTTKSLACGRLSGELAAYGRLLNVVIQRELVRMRPQPHRVHLLHALVVDVSCQQIFGEDVALEQKLVVVLQGAHRFIERTGHGWNLGQLFRPEIVRSEEHTSELQSQSNI